MPTAYWTDIFREAHPHQWWQDAQTEYREKDQQGATDTVLSCLCFLHHAAPFAVARFTVVPFLINRKYT